MRYLRRNKACRSPVNLVFFDAETTQRKIRHGYNGVENVFRLGCSSRVRLVSDTISRRNAHRYKTTDSFWDWLLPSCRKDTQTYIFAHNLPFDFTVMGGWLLLSSGRLRLSDRTGCVTDKVQIDPKKKPWTGFLVRNDPPTIIKCRTENNATLTFCDTLNWFKCSLATLGQRLAIPKLDMPAWDAPDEDWFVYCEQDVLIIERTMVDYIRWIKDNDLGNFRMTAPSQAFAAFNHRFRKPNILLHHKPEVQKLERDSYYGGRLESFYIGPLRNDTPADGYSSDLREDRQKDPPQKHCYALDVISLYPSIMRGLPYPTQLERFERFPSPEPIARVPLCHRCIADVHLQTDETYPRRVPGIGIVFARGRYRTTLAGPELIRAFRRRHITHVYSWARYTLKPLFTEFVDFFWGERQRAKEEGDLTGNLFAKLCMNSLYGKFAQCTTQWEELGKSTPGEEWGVEHTVIFNEPGIQTVQNIAGTAYIKRQKEDHPNSFAAIASYVTAYARERMRQLIETAGPENVLYIVTDGLFVTAPGYERLSRAGEISEVELGKMSLKDSCNTGWLGGIHWYEVGDIVKKGSNKKRALVLSTGHALQERWERLAGILGRGPTDTVRIYPQVKHYKREYKRGTVLPSGDVVPLVYDEPLEELSNES